MRHRGLHHSLFEWFCACIVLAPCAALAQQTPSAQQSAAAPAEGTASSSSRPAGPAHADTAHQKAGDDLEPAVDTSAGESRSSDERADASPPRPAGRAGKARPDAAGGRIERGPDAKQKAGARTAGKAVDRLELGTTDITGNRELPKVMYIVPWKRSDLGDLTGKPLNSLVDQTLEPVDRNVFERANRYYGAVTGGASQDVHRTPDAGSGSAVRDER